MTVSHRAQTKARTDLKNKTRTLKAKREGCVAHAAEHLASKCEALSLNPSIVKKKKKTGK
jgi:hypothetical protein